MKFTKKILEICVIVWYNYKVLHYYTFWRKFIKMSIFEVISAIVLIIACIFIVVVILVKDTTWNEIEKIVIGGIRTSHIIRTTKETDIEISVNLDGTGQSDINTGIGFFDHMLEQISRHGMIDLSIKAKGDLNVDKHHTIEDTAIVLGQCLDKALTDKRGLRRYGFCLPMDDCEARVSLDLGGRPWLIWNAEFKREYIGEMPTEMFLHFFKSLSDTSRMNLHVTATGNNEHHKIEGIFKAFARALRMAKERDVDHFQLPSSKGVI